jgi:hypothetical protein
VALSSYFAVNQLRARLSNALIIGGLLMVAVTAILALGGIMQIASVLGVVGVIMFSLGVIVAHVEP